MVSKYKKSFTLIEMLIVIVIIGILAAALIPRLNQLQARARNASRKAILSQIRTGIYSYTVNVGGYPYHLGLLVSGGYMSTIPSDPAVTTNNPCRYHPTYYAHYNSQGFFTGTSGCGTDGPAATSCIGYKGFMYTHGWALSHGATIYAKMEDDGSFNSHSYGGGCSWTDFGNWGNVGGITALQAIKSSTQSPLSTKGQYFYEWIEYQ